LEKVASREASPLPDPNLRAKSATLRWGDIYYETVEDISRATCVFPFFLARSRRFLHFSQLQCLHRGMSWFASKDKLRLSTGVLDIELVLGTWPQGDKSRGVCFRDVIF
jgi:hypothetical protein